MKKNTNLTRFAYCALLIIAFKNAYSQKSILLLRKGGDYSFISFYGDNKRKKIAFLLYDQTSEKKEGYLYKDKKLLQTTESAIKIKKLKKISFSIDTNDQYIKKKIRGMFLGSYTGSIKIKDSKFIVIIEHPHTQNNFFILFENRLCKVNKINPVVDYNNSHIEFYEKKKTLYFFGYKITGNSMTEFGLYCYNLISGKVQKIQSSRHGYKGYFYPLLLSNEKSILCLYIVDGQLLEVFLCPL